MTSVRKAGKKTTELCLLLIEETIGELAARIFEVLMVYGKQKLSEIVDRTKLACSLVKQGINVLISHHVVLWTSGIPTLYEADWLAAYSLVRSGRFVEAARDRLGQDSTALLSRCVLEGDVNPMQSQSDGINGSSSESGGDKITLSSALSDLLHSESAIITNASHFRTPTENRIRAEKYVLSKNPQWAEKIKIVDRPKFQQAIINTLHEWRFGSKQIKTDVKTRDAWNLGNSLKRQFDAIGGSTDDMQPSRKSIKTSSSSSAGTATHNSTHPDVLIRANYAKFPVLARSQRLVQLAADTVGITTSQVYAAVLRQCDKNIPCCDEFHTDDKTRIGHDILSREVVSAFDIAEDAPNSDELKQAIGLPPRRHRTTISPVSLHKDTPGKKRRRLELEDSDDDHQSVPPESSQDFNQESDSEPVASQPPRSTPNGKKKTNGITKETPDKKGKGRSSITIDYEWEETSDLDYQEAGAGRIIALRQHLQILTENGFLTLHPLGTRKVQTEGWSVPFRPLSHRLRISELNTTISTLFGSVALRLVRILQKHGKLEEKALLNLSLLESKAMRSRLSAMHAAGYLELQEVPRDNNRAPSKTLYLWFFDEERCARKTEQDYYHTMSRCLQRLRVERERVSDVLTKSLRSDVLGREQEFIVGAEWTRLEKWREIEKKLLAEVGRLDDGVIVLRDL